MIKNLKRINCVSKKRSVPCSLSAAAEATHPGLWKILSISTLRRFNLQKAPPLYFKTGFHFADATSNFNYKTSYLNLNTLL